VVVTRLRAKFRRRMTWSLGGVSKQFGWCGLSTAYFTEINE